MKVKVRKVAEIKQVRETGESRSWGPTVRRGNLGQTLSWGNSWDGTCPPKLSLLGTVTGFKRQEFLVYQSPRKGEQCFHSEERLNPMGLWLTHSLLDGHVRLVASDPTQLLRHWQCVSSEWRGAVSIKYTQDFQELV